MIYLFIYLFFFFFFFFFLGGGVKFDCFTPYDHYVKLPLILK